MSSPPGQAPPHPAAARGNSGGAPAATGRSAASGRPLPLGRGASINPPNRFEAQFLSLDPDSADWSDCDPDERPNPRTQFFFDASESLLVKNNSPDVGFEYGLNPYRGCEHGCAYCFARPFHEYLGWSSGLDFETKILVKRRAPELLRRELSAKRWRPQPIAMSGVTDCYQPAERHFRLTRGCLEVCAELRQPISIITKNALVTRDLDLLRELARWHCIAVNFSVTTLDPALGGEMEPRASRPAARLQAIRELSAAGIPVTVLVAPVIPGLTDHELPTILEAAARAGAKRAGYIVLRLPHTVKEIFTRWLDDHAPTKKARIIDRLRSLRGGALYDSDWTQRLSGQGIWADQLARVFDVASRRHGFSPESVNLSTEHFRRPGGHQLELFG